MWVTISDLSKSIITLLLLLTAKNPSTSIAVTESKEHTYDIPAVLSDQNVNLKLKVHDKKSVDDGKFKGESAKV